VVSLTSDPLLERPSPPGETGRVHDAHGPRTARTRNMELNPPPGFKGLLPLRGGRLPDLGPVLSLGRDPLRHGGQLDDPEGPQGFVKVGPLLQEAAHGLRYDSKLHVPATGVQPPASSLCHLGTRSPILAGNLHLVAGRLRLASDWLHLAPGCSQLPAGKAPLSAASVQSPSSYLRLVATSSSKLAGNPSLVGGRLQQPSDWLHVAAGLSQPLAGNRRLPSSRVHPPASRLHLASTGSPAFASDLHLAADGLPIGAGSLHLTASHLHLPASWLHLPSRVRSLLAGRLTLVQGLELPLESRNRRAPRNRRQGAADERPETRGMPRDKENDR